MMVKREEELTQYKSQAYDLAIQITKIQQQYNDIVAKINKLEEEE
jgi:hypothetical protein